MNEVRELLENGGFDSEGFLVLRKVEIAARLVVGAEGAVGVGMEEVVQDLGVDLEALEDEIGVEHILAAPVGSQWRCDAIGQSLDIDACGAIDGVGAERAAGEEMEKVGEKMRSEVQERMNWPSARRMPAFLATNSWRLERPRLAGSLASMGDGTVMILTPM